MADEKFTGGLTPDQVRYLNEKPWGSAFRVDKDAAKGNVFIPGEYVAGQLNRAFGFDGWGVEIHESAERFREKFTSKTGNENFRLIWSCRITLTIFTPGGRVIPRAGVGTDEAVSPNLKDCFAKAPAGALTQAIKNAAITFGAQFGLTVVRAGKRPDGTKVDWRARTQPQHPKPPAIYPIQAVAQVAAQAQDEVDHEDSDGSDGQVVEEHGVRYDSRTGIVQENPTGTGEAKPTPKASEQPAQRAQSTAAPASSAPSTSQQHAPEAAAPKPAGNGDPAGFDRNVTVQAIRTKFREVGPARFQPIFADVAKAHGYTEAVARIGRAPGDGGASSGMLLDFLSRLTSATGGA